MAAGRPLETLLDIGAGIGALTFELLERGVPRALSVDASAAFVAAGREEAVLRNRAAQVEWIQGDYVALAEKLASADLVTLDRVVCCYPRFEPLLGAAVKHARRCLALSYPRDMWYVRLGLACQNALRTLKGCEFRVVLHPPRLMEQVITSQGLALFARRTTAAWSVDIYVRAPSV
jgi:magnesium-protoporphyrin O-methyltransferase